MQAIPHLHNFIDTLSEPVHSAVMARCRPRAVRKGEVIYHVGDAPVEMYQIRSGTVRMSNVTLEGREFVATEFRPGDCFGEMGIIDGLSRASTMTAASATELSVLSRADFLALSEAFPEFNQKCMLMLCRRVRYAYNLSAEAMGLTLHDRLGVTICRLAHSHGQLSDDGSHCIAISQEELGRRLGASRQSINKELNALVKAGAIDLRYGKIHIADLDELEARYTTQMGNEMVVPVYSTP